MYEGKVIKNNAILPKTEYLDQEAARTPELVRIEEMLLKEVIVLREYRSDIFNLVSRIDTFKLDCGEEDDIKKGYNLETHQGRLFDLLEQLRNENSEFKIIINHLKDLV